MYIPTKPKIIFGLPWILRPDTPIYGFPTCCGCAEPIPNRYIPNMSELSGEIAQLLSLSEVNQVIDDINHATMATFVPVCPLMLLGLPLIVVPPIGCMMVSSLLMRGCYTDPQYQKVLDRHNETLLSRGCRWEAHQPISEEPVDVCCCCCGVMISSIKLVAIPSSQSIPLQPVEFPTSAGPPGNKFPSAPSYSYSAVPAHPQQFQQPQPQGVNMIYVQQPNQPQGVAIAVPVQQQQGTQMVPVSSVVPYKI